MAIVTTMSTEESDPTVGHVAFLQPMFQKRHPGHVILF